MSTSRLPKSAFALGLGILFLPLLYSAEIQAANNCVATNATADADYEAYKSTLAEGATAKGYCDQSWRDDLESTRNGTEIVEMAQLKDGNQFEQQAKEMDSEYLSGSDFGEAAREGVRGSGFMQAAGANQTAEALRQTSQNIHRAGQVARVGTYLGYAAAAGTIGSAVVQYSESEDGNPSETAEKINKVAATTSLIVGAGNVVTGATGYMLARKYDSRGIARIEELRKNENLTKEQKLHLDAAERKLKAAQSKANGAAIGMVVNGGLNIAAGIATRELKRKIKQQQQELSSLEDDPVDDVRTSAPSTGSGTTGSELSNGATTPATSGTVASGNGNTSGGTANTSTSGGDLSQGAVGSGDQPAATITNLSDPNFTLGKETFETPDEAKGIQLAALSDPGASIDPTRFNSGKKGAGGKGGSTPGPAGAAGGGEIGGGDSSAADEIMAAELAEDSDPLANDVGFAEGGGGGFGAFGGGGTDDGMNPISSVFGQIGKFAKDLQGGDKKKRAKRRYSRRGLASGAANRIQDKEAVAIHDKETNLFHTVRKKLFLMKYRGNI